MWCKDFLFTVSFAILRKYFTEEKGSLLEVELTELSYNFISDHLKNISAEGSYTLNYATRIKVSYVSLIAT